MSSLLNVSNDASRKPEEFSLKDIKVFVDSEEQNWFKRAHVVKFLVIEDIQTSLNGLESVKFSLGKSSGQPGVARRFGLDLKISITRRINSSHSLGLCMSL